MFFHFSKTGIINFVVVFDSGSTSTKITLPYRDASWRLHSCLCRTQSSNTNGYSSTPGRPMTIMRLSEAIGRSRHELIKSTGRPQISSGVKLSNSTS